MALTEVYVDPSIAADSGTGTIGDPYGDLEYAIEQTTFDTTNGTRVNIKAGTAEVLAAELGTAMQNVVTTVAWVPSDAAPCVFQGYTAVAGDGGIGEIDGNGTVSIINQLSGSQGSNIIFKDLKLGNTGANDVLGVDNACIFEHCWIHTSTGRGIQGGNYCNLSSCYFDNVGDAAGNAINTSTISHIVFCVFENCDVGSGSIVNATGGLVEHNVVICAAAANTGIRILNNAIVRNNTIYQPNAGTGIGIRTQDSTQNPAIVEANLVEGFSGAGGVGIQATDDIASIVRGNAVYNCTTSYDLTSSGAIQISDEDNEVLTASPFNDAANGDFSPVNVGNVIEGALPQVIGGGLV